jgi:uncharacterized protein (TIGR03435 family)
MKEFKADNLVIAKGGLKLKDSIPTDGCSRGAISAAGKECGPVSEHFGIAKASGEGQEMMMISPQGLSTAKNYTISDFVHALRNHDIRMQYATIDLRNGRPFDEDSPMPTIFDALQKQLGLKLEPTKAMIEMMVIDHVDATPTEN